MAHYLTSIAYLFAASLLVSTPIGSSADARPPQRNIGDKPLVLIVSPRLNVNELSSTVVKRVFLGEPTDAGGKRLIPFNYAAETRMRLDFDRVVLGMAADESGRYWVDRRIRGQGDAPRTVPTPQVARAVVAHLVGAIAYITPEHVDSTVKALRVDGRNPDDSGYLYRVR